MEGQNPKGRRRGLGLWGGRRGGRWIGRWIGRMAALVVLGVTLLAFVGPVQGGGEDGRLLRVRVPDPEAMPPMRAPERRYLKGWFLIAGPDMGDPRFQASVILLCHHTPEGALGLIINRPMVQIDSALLLAQIQARAPTAPQAPPPSSATGEGPEKLDLFYGGPVAPRQGFVLHSPDYSAPDTEIVTQDLALSREPAILEDIIKGEGPARYRIAFGYAGWGPGQLERELNRGDWRLAPSAPDLVFDTDSAPVDLWQRALTRQEIQL